MLTRKPIIPDGLEKVYRDWHFAPAVIANGMIYCSGIVGTSADGEVPDQARASSFEGARETLRRQGSGLAELRAVKDPEGQFATAFEGLRSVLEAAGAGLADVVELVTYHVDIHTHMAGFMRVKDRYLEEPYPAWTAVGVSELIVPGGLVELRATAILPAP